MHWNVKDSFFCLNIVSFGSKDCYLPMMELREIIVCNTDLWQCFFQSVKVVEGVEKGDRWTFESYIMWYINRQLKCYRRWFRGMKNGAGALQYVQAWAGSLQVGNGTWCSEVKAASSRQCFSCPDTSHSGQVACKYPCFPWFPGKDWQGQRSLTLRTCLEKPHGG